MKNNMKNKLQSILGPNRMSDFYESYTSNLPFLNHHPEDSLKELRDLPFLASLKALLNSWPKSVEAHLPDVRDEASAIETNSANANQLFNNGMALLFNEAHDISPVLTEWLHHLRQDLGLSSLTLGRCLIYATPDGKGTAPHFDQNINFVLQISGTKKWRMAPNKSVINPLTRHTMGLEVIPEMMSYLDQPLPVTMPDDSEVFELRPGSLLFVPRGYWHETEATGEALSLNFTYSAPTWIDLLSAALRGRLAQSPEWRETADGLCDPVGRKEAEKRFNYLLSGLVQDLPHWNAGDILNATEGDDLFFEA